MNACIVDLTHPVKGCGIRHCHSHRRIQGVAVIHRINNQIQLKHCSGQRTLNTPNDNYIELKSIWLGGGRRTLLYLHTMRNMKYHKNL